MRLGDGPRAIRKGLIGASITKWREAVRACPTARQAVPLAKDCILIPSITDTSFDINATQVTCNTLYHIVGRKPCGQSCVGVRSVPGFRRAAYS